MRKKLLALIGGVLFLVSMPSHAVLTGIVDHDTYLTDTTSGLDWLDVTTTSGLSYDYVFSQLGSGGAYEGWRYATASEFGTLLSNTNVTTAITGVRQSAILSETSTNHGELIALLGDTFDIYYQHHYGMSYCDLDPNYCPSGTVRWAFGYVADTHPTDPDLQASAIITDDDRRNIYNDIAYTGNVSKRTSTSLEIGSFLVRSAARVPEPGSLALLGIGLLGLSISRRRK